MVLYENGIVRVDGHFARFGEKSFAINKINSVEVRRQHIPASKAWVAVGAIALLILLGSTNADTLSGGIPWAVFALGCAGISFLMYRGSKPIDIYRLFLMTSSSEVQAYETRDADDIRKLRSAVEEAIARS